MVQGGPTVVVVLMVRVLVGVRLEMKVTVFSMTFVTRTDWLEERAAETAVSTQSKLVIHMQG
jgi:hypothetical protein